MSLTDKFTAEGSLLRSLAIPLSQPNPHPEVTGTVFINNKDNKKQNLKWKQVHIDVTAKKEDGVSDLMENIKPDLVNEVRALPDEVQVDEKERKKIAEKLQAFRETLRSRHDEAREQFLSIKKAIHKELETEVSIISKSLKERLNKGEKEIDATLLALTDSKLLEMDLNSIVDEENRINGMFDSRLNSIYSLSDQYENIELKRARLIDSELKRLVGRLTDIAYMLLPDIERICQFECTEVNSSILKNRSSYADIIARLKLLGYQKKESVRSLFAERKIAWRQLRHNKALDEFKVSIKDKCYVCPNERVAMFVELKKIQKLEVMGSEKVPTLSTSNVKKIYRHLIELRSSLDEVADRGLIFLTKHESSLQSNGMKLLSYLRTQLSECGAVSDEQISAIIESDCLPSVNEVVSFVSELKSRLEGNLLSEEKRLQIPALAFTNFYVSAAGVYELFEKSVNKLNEDISEKFNECKDKYDDNIKELEEKLDSVLCEMNIAPNLDELERLWASAKELVGESSQIEMAHRNYNRDSASIAASHAIELKSLLNDYKAKFAALFSLELSRSNDSSKEIFSSSKENVYFELVSPNEFTENILSMPVVNENEEDAAPVDATFVREFDPVYDKDGTLCFLHLTFSTVIVTNSLQTLRQSFIDQWEYYGAQSLEFANTQATARQSDLAKEINQLLRVHRPRIRRVESEYFEKRAVELSQNKSKFDRFLARYMSLLSVNDQAFAGMFNETESFIERYTEESKNYMNATLLSENMNTLQGISKKLKEANTNASVQLDLMTQKLSKITSELILKSEVASKSYIDSCRLKPNKSNSSNVSRGVTPATPTLNTSGSKSLIASNSKTLIKSNSKVSLSSTGVSIVIPSNRLLEQDEQNDGTFHPLEVEYYQGEAKKASLEVQKTIQDREKTLVNIKKKIEEVLSVKLFDESFHNAMEDVCMNQSLGRIYGAPKMKATIRLREEFMISESQQDKLKNMLVHLVSLIKPSAISSMSAHSTPDMSTLSSNILVILDSIRNEALSRAVYLSILKRNVPAPKLILELPNDFGPFLSPYSVDSSAMLSFEEKKQDDKKVDDKKSLVSKDAKKDVKDVKEKDKTTFLEQAAKINRDARVEMSAIYSTYWSQNSSRLLSMGKIKPDFIKTDSDNCPVPEPFVERLLAESKRAKQNHEAYGHEFKHFLQELCDVLPNIPRVVYTDILNRTQTLATFNSSNLLKVFKETYNRLLEVQNHNKIMLKPSLANPDLAPLLDDLKEKELSRSKSVRSLLTNLKNDLFQNQSACANLFSRRILFVSYNLMTLFDTSVAPVDLNIQDIEQSHVEKSLKKSMRQYLRSEKDYDARQRYLTKTWPGISLEFEVSPSLPALDEKIDDKAGSKSVDKTTTNVKKPLSGKENISTSVEKFGSIPSMTGFKTEQNREIIAQRDQTISAYRAFFDANIKQIIEITDRYLTDEENWTKNWNSMIERLTAV